MTPGRSFDHDFELAGFWSVAAGERVGAFGTSAALLDADLTASTT
jgi:hypothetical protein